MATADEARRQRLSPRTERTRPRRDGLFRFTVEQFQQLDELGLFADRRVELIRGVLYEMTTQTPHATASRLANQVFQAIFREGWVISQCLPLQTGHHSLLEPDLSIVAGSIRDFVSVHPKSAALVVEISDSTLRKDRELKSMVYAQAGISEYWIVNLIERQLEVYREPGPDPERPGRFRYASVTIVSGSGRIAPLAAPDSVVPVSDLLP